MKRIRTVLPLALGLVLVVTIAAIASPALVNENANPNFVSPDDAAISSSVSIPVQADDPSDGSKWGLRTFQNKRGERCIDAGRILAGEFTRPTPTGNKKILAGQGGACGPAKMKNQIAVFGVDVEGMNRQVVAALLEPNVERVEVTTPDGLTTKLLPQGENHAIFGVFADVQKTHPTTGDEVEAEMKKRQKSARGPGPDIGLSLKFKDGSELALNDKGASDPAEGSMAHEAFDALNSPAGR